MRFIRTPQAAEILGIAAATLERWRSQRSDGPPFRKFGTAVVYDVDELVAWATAHAETPTASRTGRRHGRDPARRDGSSMSQRKERRR